MSSSPIRQLMLLQCAYIYIWLEGVDSTLELCSYIGQWKLTPLCVQGRRQLLKKLVVQDRCLRVHGMTICLLRLDLKTWEDQKCRQQDKATTVLRRPITECRVSDTC